jgi:hypothetical protein
VAVFRRGESIEQLPRPGVAGSLSCSLVEVAGVDFHPRHLLSDSVETEVLNQPDGPAVIEACDVLAAYQRNRLSKSPAVRLAP